MWALLTQEELLEVLIAARQRRRDLEEVASPVGVALSKPKHAVEDLL